MIEEGRLKMRLSSELARALIELSERWGVTPEQAIREMIASDWSDEKTEAETLP